jgi:hypothetical protein
MKEPLSAKFASHLGSIGLRIEGASSSGRVQWADSPNEPVAQAVFASIDKPLGSTECLELRELLGPESKEWAAYVEARKAPIKQQREERYRAEAEPFRSSIDEFYEIGSKEWLAAIEVWKAVKQGIRDELPYPDGSDSADEMTARVQAMQVRYPVKLKT